MVKAALGSRYHDKEITKEQYKAVNREVSRKLYDMIGDASALTGQEEKKRWQGVADEEVSKSIAQLGPSNTLPVRERIHAGEVSGSRSGSRSRSSGSR